MELKVSVLLLLFVLDSPQFYDVFSSEVAEVRLAGGDDSLFCLLVFEEFEEGFQDLLF